MASKRGVSGISKRCWTVKCQEAQDGSGDMIVDLPSYLLAEVGLNVGDKLTIEAVEGGIVLTPLVGRPFL